MSISYRGFTFEMLSQKTLPSILDKVDRWTQEELSSNINDVLPILTSSLKNVEQKSLSLRSVHILLDRCLQCVPVSELDSSILKYALPTARSIFSEALEGINVVLQDSENFTDEEVELTLKSLHHVCFGLLDQFNKVLITMSSFCPLSAEKVASVPCTILQLLQTAFVHCRESEEMYSTCPVYLMELFKNSQVLLSYLEPLLLSGLQFSSSSEEDETLLRNVLESLASLASATTTLGIRVQTIAWKTYVVLVERYCAFRDLWIASDISSPLEVLASSTYDIFVLLLNTQLTDIKIVVKILAVLSFLVRVLTRLCNAFTGYLTETCMPSLFKLLNLLHRSCVSDEGDKEKHSIMLKEIERRVGVASTNLISSLINDRSFVQSYFSTIKKISKTDSPLGCLLMGTSLCRALVCSDSEIRKQWISNPESHIIMCIFELLGMCHNDLCTRKKFVSVNAPGKPARFVDLYEHVLTPAGALVLLVPAENFDLIEELLLKNIAVSDPWRGLFALDLWCIVARQSPAGVRMSHVTFVLQLLDAHCTVQCSPKPIHLRILLVRLWPLLSIQQQKILLNKFPPMTMPEVWTGVCLNKDILENVVSVDVFCDTASSMECFLANSQVETFKKMVKDMKYSLLLLSLDNNSLEAEDVSSHLISSLSAIWLLISTPLMEFADECWLSYFLSIVCDLTAKLCMVVNNLQLEEILKRTLKFFTSFASHLKLKALTIIYALAEKVFDSDSQQQCVFQMIVNVFVSALQDKNVFVQQEAFQVFEYFAHVTSHEEIIKKCLKNNKTIQEKVTMYLKKSPVPPENSNESFVYADCSKIQNQIKFVHQCKIKNANKHTSNQSQKYFSNLQVQSNSVFENNENVPESVTDAIQNLQKDIQFLSKLCKTTHFSKAAKATLSVKIDKVVKSISDISLSLK